MKSLDLKLLCFVLFLMLSSFLEAQSTYSYISDRKFTDPSDLIGYNFLPNAMEVPNEREEEIEPGAYSFGVTLNNLYVNGEDIKGVYSVNNINPTEYGYKLNLMNARDPTIQGHLKIILNKYYYVDALVFKRSRKDEEMIFYQSPIPKKVLLAEKEYFTDRYDTLVENIDSIWGKTVQPFLQVHTSKNVQQRMQKSDSLKISFIETITIIDKTKKKRKKKRKKDEEAEKEEVAVDKEEVREEEVDEEIEEELTEKEKKKRKKKIKIIKKYSIEVRAIVKYEDGSVEDKKEVYPIKKVAELEDDTAPPGGERFQLEFNTDKKGKDIFLYLTPERTISSLEIGGKRYLMRGF
ncbi:MAG: hypothetical protein AB8G15_00165 [Saprospiraceae bacterium]